jgi:hypothetical protein
MGLAMQGLTSPGLLPGWSLELVSSAPESFSRGQREEEVAGLTTAATIWVTAGIGIAAGAGMYLVAVIAAAVILGVLVLPKIRG